MKAARRQELKTNELSVYIQGVVDYFKEHYTKVVVLVAAVVLVGGALIYRAQTRIRTQTDGWNAYFEAGRATPDPSNPEWSNQAIQRWEQVIAAYSDENIKSSSIWALASFCRQQAAVQQDPQAKDELLQRAQQNCLKITENYTKSVPLYGAALMELASLEQDRFVIDRNMEHRAKSRAYLQRILDDNMFQGSPYRTEARVRLNGFDDLWTVPELVEPPIPLSEIEGPIKFDLPPQPEPEAVPEVEVEAAEPEAGAEAELEAQPEAEAEAAEPEAEPAAQPEAAEADPPGTVEEEPEEEPAVPDDAP